MQCIVQFRRLFHKIGWKRTRHILFCTVTIKKRLMTSWKRNEKENHAKRYKSIRKIVLWSYRIPFRCTIINMQIFWLGLSDERATPKGDFKCIEDTIVSGPTLHEQSRGTWFLCQQVPRWITRDSRTNSSANRIPLERGSCLPTTTRGTMLSRILSSNVTDIDTRNKV